MTLAQFSAQIDDHLHYPAGFAEHVTGLADVRDIIARTEARRKASHDELKARYAGGSRVYTLGGGERRVLVERESKPTLVKAVSSAAAKKADPAAWAKAKVLKQWRSVVAPEDHVNPLAMPSIPPLPWNGADLATVAGLYQSPAWDVIGELRDTERDHFDALDKIAADAGWDGQEYVFTDGWHIMLTTPRYDSEAFRRAAPKLWNQLAEVGERGGGSRLVIMDWDKAVDLGLVDDEGDLDEIDGD